MYLQILLITHLLFYNLNIANRPQSIKYRDFYTEGVKQRESGNWKEALNIWLVAKDTLLSHGTYDPRIGIAFIELVTQKKAKEYYPIASKMYLWGFSDNNLEQYKEEVQKEVERIAPLLDKKEYSNWEKYLENHDATLFSKIRSFWAQKDPAPTTEINERLIEHWQRIAHIRNKFRTDSTNVFGTDDRGLIFVKYGEPNIIYQDKLGIDQFELMRWVDDFLIRQEIQRYNTLPEFEIWLYVTINSDESTIFLFGKRAGMGKFALRAGIEDFIPDRAFRRSSATNTRGILPGFMLQIQYYGELINFDRFYLDRYRELETIWSNARAAGRISPNYDVLRGLLGHYRGIDKDNAKQKYLPLDQSDYVLSLDPMDLLYKRIRILFLENKPMLFVMAASAAHSDIEDKKITFFRKQTKSRRYKMKHFLIVYDKNWNEIYRTMEDPSEKSINTSLFMVPQLDANYHYMVVAERTISSIKESNIPESDMPDTSRIIGIGKATLQDRTPLTIDTKTLEVSDLILGVKTPAGLDTTFSYPFPVVPRDRIRKTKPLHVYLEIYHLLLGSNKQANFRINSRIKKIKRKGKIDENKEMLSKSFDFKSSESTTKKTLEIDISNLTSGQYELELKIIDKISSQEKKRKELFEIIE